MIVSGSVKPEKFFTGLNNLRVLSVADVEHDEHFGFTDSEVRAMLDYYGCSGKYELVRTWYDGYRFGNADVYCPWDVINYCAKLRADPDAYPEASGIVIEVKYPDSSNLDSGCRKALEQIEKMGYETRLRQEGMKTIIKSGIACAKKECMVMLAE